MASPITIEDADIAFRNFSGKAGKYNREGDRSFAVILRDEDAKILEADGWNVKYLKPRDEGEQSKPYLSVKVNFNGRPPNTVLVTSRGKSRLGEDQISMFDWVQIAKADLIINPYEYNVNGSSGISAYCSSLFITMVEDDLDRKYADVPDSAASAMVQAEDTPPF